MYRHELLSSDGDAFTLMCTFEEWLAVKATGRASLLADDRNVRGGSGGHAGSGAGCGSVRMSSSRWCRRAGVEEQRMYDMAKVWAKKVSMRECVWVSGGELNMSWAAWDGVRRRTRRLRG
eukprot:366369-Chlamydomonas_euryale.AAC.11